MEQMRTRFVVTAWRDRAELLAVRRDIFSSDIDDRERAVHRIFAWRVRKLEIPLLLESTADLVHAAIQDERRILGGNGLRMVYATAVSRFITGLADTQTELSRLRPSFFPAQKNLQFPLALRETRHCIVHRHLPSLAELKRAAKESLDWLWEWYWSHLDAAFSNADVHVAGEVAGDGEVYAQGQVKDRMQKLLKQYLSNRKDEVKNRKKTKDRVAGRGAAQSYSEYEAPARLKQKCLLDVLVDEKALLPADKKFGTSMSGAFLLWSPFLVHVAKTPGFLRLLLDRILAVMSAPAPTASGSLDMEQDPTREGLHGWAVHILSAKEWEEARSAEPRLADGILGQSFTTPTYWSLKLAESLLESETIAGRQSWLMVLQAAKGEEADADADADLDVDVDMEAGSDVDNMDLEAAETALPVRETGTSEKGAKRVERIRGPQKKLGLWKPQPIGTIPVGWEADE